MRYWAKDTLTAVEMNEGETIHFVRQDGVEVTLRLISTKAWIIRTTLDELKVEKNAARTDYQFEAVLEIDGETHRLEREVSTQRSFYEPWNIAGLNIWLDAVSAIFEFLTETHGDCRPNRHARLALQDATLRICPVPLYPWCPIPENTLRIEDCYRGEDCWMGAYNGASAHGGLDINHDPETPLWAPIEIHDHYYFNSLEMGHNNNRWRGIHRWPNGAEWILQAHHMTRLTVPEHTPIPQGQHYSDGSGVHSGSFHHSHFVFKVHDRGETILLDPWILFWQIYHDLPHWNLGPAIHQTTKGIRKR